MHQDQHHIEYVSGELRRGNRRAQELFYRRFAPRLLTICLRYIGDREEAGYVLNAAMLHIFRSLDDYEETGKLEAWLATIVRRTILTHLRDEGRAQRRFHDKTFVWPTSVPNLALDRLAVNDILKLLDRLPDHLRLVFNLFVFDDYRHDEIAAELGITVAASRWRLSKARELLRGHYRQGENINDSVL